MTKNKAIKKSIKHWEENVKKLEEWDKKGYVISNHKSLNEWKVTGEKEVVYLDADHCALCDEYYKTTEPCSKCPLANSGFGCDTEGSIWRDCVEAIGNAEIIASAKKMLEVLRGLL